MRPPNCADCGAFLQEARMGGQSFYRCPWARETHQENWHLDTYHVIVRIYCGHPLDGKRVTTGMTVESVP